MRTLKYALLIVTLFVPAMMLAQMGHGRMGGRHMPSVDDQVKHLSEQLNLTDTQKTQVKAILQDQHDQMKKVMQNSSGSREDNWSKMREIHQNASAKVRDLLTDEQKTKYDKLEQERQQRMQERHGGGENKEGPPSD